MPRSERLVAENLPLRAHCAQHGAYEGVLSRLGVREFRSSCPACRTQREEKFAPVPDARALLRAGIPARYAQKTLANFCVSEPGQAAALAQARALVAAVLNRPARAPCLLFLGRPGTGKSHLACAVVQALLPRRSARRYRQVDLLRELRDTRRRESPLTEREFIERLAGLDLLVLDEVGAQPATEAERGQLFDVLDARYESRRPTLLVSNLNLEALQQELGERVIDRLREGERALVVFDWASQRPLV